MKLSRAFDYSRNTLTQWSNRKVSAVIEKDLDARNVSDWIELTEAKSPKTGIVHALRYRWDGIYELVADYRGSGEVTPLW